MTANQGLSGLDFGNRADQGTVSGVKFNDLDGDGVRDPGEPGLAGWTVYADLNNNRALDAGEPSAMTGADGAYALTLPSGSYNLREVPRPGGSRPARRSAASSWAGAGSSGTAADHPSSVDAAGAVVNTFAGPVPTAIPGAQGLARRAQAACSTSTAADRPAHALRTRPGTGAVLDADPLPATPEIAGLAYFGGQVYVQVHPADQSWCSTRSATPSSGRSSVAADIIGGMTGAADLGLLFASNATVRSSPSTRRPGPSSAP